MNFFRSVFSDDSESTDSHDAHNSPPNSAPAMPSFLEEIHPISNPNLPSSAVSTWSFGGLIKNLASKSESMMETYRRDLVEFGSELKKETTVLRDVASRAMKDLPDSFEVGTSVAQESLESVGQAIDDFGSSVWRGTAEIISHGKESLLVSDHDTDYSSDNSQQWSASHGFSAKPYSRFDTQLRAIQADYSTYTEDPSDLNDFNTWKLGFDLEEKAGEIKGLLSENKLVEGFYKKLLPNTSDDKNFWSRYFYRIHKLKQAEDARADLVKRAISADEEELTWDVDDESDTESNPVELNGHNVVELKSDLSENRDSKKASSSDCLRDVGNSGDTKNVPFGSQKSGSSRGNSDVDSPTKSTRIDADKISEIDQTDSEAQINEKLASEAKGDTGDSAKDSDVSIVSIQPSILEVEDLGWDEIEDLGSNDESKVPAEGSAVRADFHRKLSAAEEEEDLTWDIEDDEEPAEAK